MAEEEEEEVEAPRFRAEEERLEEEEEDLERRRSPESIRREGVVEGNWERLPENERIGRGKWQK